MKTFVALPLALGILAASAAAAQTADAYRPHHARRLAGHPAVTHLTNALAPFTAAVPPAVYPARPWSPYPYTDHKTNGLSRNPWDCAAYGCIDTGG
jgi:hypothetical protein